LRSEGLVRYDEIVRADLLVKGRFNEDAYRRFIRLAGISEVLDRDTILKNLKCASDVNSELCFTNAGALFFRNNEEDIEFRHAGVVCALYKGTDKVYILDAKELSGDIMSKVDDAILFPKKHLRMSSQIVSVRRENVLELPEDALREAVVNAVCHREYFEKGTRVMVEIFDDRVDIVSPGGVCKGITPDNFGTISITRNSTLATLLHRSHYIEQMGTGIRRMRNATREAQVADPEFELTGFFKVTFKRNPLNISIGRQSTANRLQSATTADRKLKIISFLEEHHQATVSDFISIIELSEGRVRDVLRDMVSDGTIEKVGDKRYAYYVLKSQLASGKPL
jgi:ATP-dependent DNA helicase RecG